MPDYGHELILGTFVVPQSAWPERPVELALITERAGLDLVTFMDHPHNAGFLDTWTLLSFVAARTERVHLSGYVLNLPSRPPAFLARAAASLDLLSGGRFELGIGPGDYYVGAENAAMGAPLRSRRESLEALDEAIEIVRGTWDTSSPAPLVLEGEHYRVTGAMRGPRPAHDIGIWIPAAGPRGRRLAGRKADGWIAGGLWMHDVDRELAEANRIIDDAAATAGREPRAVRRVFDFGPAHFSVERLLPLALEHGVSTFILVGDDPAAIERWGGEVGPALREAVASVRSPS